MEVLHRESFPAACKIPLPSSCVHRQFYKKYSVLFHGTYHTYVIVTRIEHIVQSNVNPSFSKTLEQGPAMKPSVAKRGEAKFLQQQLLESPTIYGKLQPKLLSGEKRRKGEADFFHSTSSPSLLSPHAAI